MYCFKMFYTLKPSTHIKINFKNYSNMFRSNCTIIREHVVFSAVRLDTWYQAQQRRIHIDSGTQT